MMSSKPLVLFLFLFLFTTSIVIVMANPIDIRRLSARRGSLSAADPFGKNNHLNRASSSILTIVRVASPPPSPSIALQDPPQRRLQPRRIPEPPSARLSFAFSSFASGPAPGGPANSQPSPSSSPSSSPRVRAASPHRHSFHKPRLTPDQLLDLARQSTSPRPFQPHSPSSASHSPVLHPRSHSPFRPASPQQQPPPQQATAPATFISLPDHIYLPFIDRPSEVAALISQPPSAKLFSLLAQTFPADPNPSPEFPKDPAKWSYTHLQAWLTQVDRAVAPDSLWVLYARRAILFHSELIWERIKGALGVPPELDVDLTDDLDDHGSSSSSVNTDEISDDEGMAAKGHWDDWDATMDSPVFRRGDSPVVPTALKTALEGEAANLGASFSLRRPEGDETISPTPAGEGTEHDYDYQLLSIEPLLASSIPPPLSLPSSLALLDIAEGAEDEAEAEGEDGDTSTDPNTKEREDEGLIDPTQIQGLRISTSPLPVSPILGPVSPLPPYPHVPYAGSQPHSRSSSFGSSLSSSGVFARSGSFGSLVGLAGLAARGDDPYDPVADRGPGNPLFPGNFARLALAPTLSAK